MAVATSDSASLIAVVSGCEAGISDQAHTAAMESGDMKVSIVNGICARHDAISDAVIGTQRAIVDQYGIDPIIYCYSCDYTNIPHSVVRGVGDLLLNEYFMNSDIIIYHFGIHYELFNSIYLYNKARKIVRYHNVTPASLLPASQLSVLLRSNQQKANCAAADSIWADSLFNKQDLIEYGISPEIISVEPLFLKFKTIEGVDVAKDSLGVELLFVGRFVESKGILDLLEAVSTTRAKNDVPIRLKLVGNQKFSDPVFISNIKSRVQSLGVEDIVDFEGQVSDERLQQLYHRADIFVLPSYHEGFCVPLIEALQNRCVPLTYAAGNLESLVDRWGVVVKTGDKAALGDALSNLVGQFKRGRPRQLHLGARKISWEAYERGIDSYLQTFTFGAFTTRVRAGIDRVLAAG